LKVTTETVATREVLLTIEPDAQDVQNALKKAARQISRSRPLRGYRPGKAPYGLVERTFGHETILNEALKDLAPGAYREAIKEAGIEPYERGELEVQSTDPVVLKVTVPLVPLVTLGDYQTLRIEPEPEVSVSDEQIDEQVQQVRRRLAQYETVDRPVQLGDQVVASVTGIADGKKVVDNQNATLNVQDLLPPPGFAEALVGMSKGETREFSLTYPKDFHEESLAGKNVSFSVMVKAVRQVDLPEIDDDLAKEAGDYETLAEMREDLGVQLKRQLERQSQEREAHAAIEALVAQATVNYPSAAVERQVDIAFDRQRVRLQQVGYDFQRYLQMTGKTEAQLRDELRPEAERTLIRSLVLAEFARAEGLSIDESELAGGMANVAATYGDRAAEVMDRLRDQRAVFSIHNQMLTRKAMTHLRDLLTGRITQDDETQQLDEPAETESAEVSETQSTEETIETDQVQGDDADQSDDTTVG